MAQPRWSQKKLKMQLQNIEVSGHISTRKIALSIKNRQRMLRLFNNGLVGVS
jgi:hypothetical protein